MFSNSAEEVIAEDAISADLKWSIFVAALNSYRTDTVLKPYPSLNLSQTTRTNDNIDMSNGEQLPLADLRNIVKTVPDFPVVLKNGLGNLPIEQRALIQWVLESPKFHISTHKKEKYYEIEKLTGQAMKVPPPNYVFEINYNSALEKKWLERQASQEVHFAYHGSKLENFHSIINYGLQSHLSKNALFGEGVYLAGELSVSLPYAPTGSGWPRSCLAPLLSCIAVCQVIDDPTAVKCQLQYNGDGVAKSRTRAPGSMGGDVPEKYYVVRNNDMMRVKYLLVYTSGSAPKSKSKHKWTWLSDHKTALMMACYVILLLCIGLYNSSSFRSLLKKYIRKQ